MCGRQGKKQNKTKISQICELISLGLSRSLSLSLYIYIYVYIQIELTKTKMFNALFLIEGSTCIALLTRHRGTRLLGCLGEHSLESISCLPRGRRVLCVTRQRCDGCEEDCAERMYCLVHTPVFKGGKKEEHLRDEHHQHEFNIEWIQKKQNTHRHNGTHTGSCDSCG